MKEEIASIIRAFSSSGFTDKSTVHSYDLFYPDLYFPFVGKSPNILEIGVDMGGNLGVLAKVFPDGKIFGIDCDYSRVNYGLIKENVALLPVCDQSSRQHFNSLPELDIIIEDASHQYNKSIESFVIFSEKLKPGGVYVIEDIYPHFLHLYMENPKFEIFDFRDIKGRQDDVVAVYRKPQL